MSGRERFGIIKKVFGVHKYVFLFCVISGKGQMNSEPGRK